MKKLFVLVFNFFPAIHTLLVLVSLYLLIKNPNPLSFFLFIFATYLLAPICWRIVSLLSPPKKGVSYIGKKAEKVNSWIFSYQLQQFYNALPFVENILKVFPGFYSIWLRLWGAQIGKKINWTTQSLIVDRPFIHIGDRCLIGNQSYLSAHAIKKKEDKYILYLQDVKVENDVVIAVQALIGPGVQIKSKAFVSARAGVKPGTIISEGECYERFS